MSKKIRKNMPRATKGRKSKVATRSNRSVIIFVIAFAVIGSFFLIRSFAAPAPISGTISKRPSSTIQEPYVLEWSFSKPSRQLERPHINLSCFRDENGDGTIDTSSWSSPDLVYGSQSYLFNSVSTYGPVVITQDSKAGSKGYITIDLLSGSSKLVYESSTAKTVMCNAELKVWDGNLRQQTGGTLIAKTPFVTLTDTR